MNAYQWHVLGAGAIGTLFAAALVKAGLAPALVLRAAPDSPDCPVLVERDGDNTSLSVPWTAAQDTGPIDHLLVTTKAYDVEAAVASIRHRLTPRSQLVLLVNGMGLAERIAQLAPEVQLYCGSTTEGAYRLGDSHIRHAGSGTTLIGSLQGAAEPAWFQPLQTLELQCHWHGDIASALWHKLAINCAINPLTALNRCRNGELGSRIDLREQVNTLCMELAAVSEAAGFSHTATTIRQDALRVIRDTGDNQSSMLQDVMAGRPTEIDFITGHLLARGAELGVPCPLNQELFERITQIEY